MAEVLEFTPVDLDSLNPKQLGKEFKAAQKEIKSKDMDIKRLAFKKFENVRYLTEGGCLLPFINSIVPKKKTLDLSMTSLEELLKFLDRNQDDLSTAQINKSLKAMYEAEGSLNVLKVLSDVITMREEIKKPKKKKVKKGEEPPPEEIILENPVYESLRRASLKCIYCFGRALYAAPEFVNPDSTSGSAATTTPTSTVAAGSISQDPAVAKVVSKADVQGAVAKVENLWSNLCDVIMSIKPDLLNEDVELKAKAVQDGAYALMLLSFTLKHNCEAANSFAKSDVAQSLQELSHQPQFTLYCVQILETLSRHVEGVALLKTAAMQSALMELLHSSTTILEEAGEAAAAAANSKDKGKKEAPKKGAPEPAADPMEALDLIPVELPRSALAVVKLISKIYISIGSQMNPTVEMEVVQELIPLVSRNLVNPQTHEIIRGPTSLGPLDEELADSVDTMCIMVGTLGLVSAEVRCATYQSGALAAALSVLNHSREIITGLNPSPPPPTGKGAPPPPAAEVEVDDVEKARLDQRLVELRRVSEKAILNLVTETMGSPLGSGLSATSPLAAAAASAGHHVDGGGVDLPVRWTSCFARTADVSAFEVASNINNNDDDAAASALLAGLVDMIGVENDEDLANRGVRMLAAILHGHDHPVELIQSKELNSALVNQISLVIQQRGEKLVNEEVVKDIMETAAIKRQAKINAEAVEEKTTLVAGDADVEEVAAALESTTLADSGAAVDGPTVGGGALSEDEAAAEAAAEVAAAAESPPTSAPIAPPNVLIPRTCESLFLALSVMELLLMTNPDTVNAFATRERVQVLADLLRALGPVGNPSPSDSGGGGLHGSRGVLSRNAEYIAVLHDPRRHHWSSSNPLTYNDHALLRPLICDVLTLVAAAGPKFRTYDNEDAENSQVPLTAPPCEPPVPPTTSPCDEAALIVSALASDACCSVLLSQASFQWCSTGSMQLNVNPSATFSLDSSVEQSALSLLRAICQLGIKGVAGVLEAIATSGFAYFVNAAEIDVSDVDALDMSATTKDVLASRCAMRDFAAALNKLGQPEEPSLDPDVGADDAGAMPVPACSSSIPFSDSLADMVQGGYSWTRPLFFDEAYPIPDTVITTQDNIMTNLQIWPYVVLCASLMHTLSNPRTPRLASALSVDTLNAATKDASLGEPSQSVISDAVAAVFLSMGGGVALSGLLGRFGNLDETARKEATAFASYLLSRGQCREEFWREWEESHREEIPIDPKTGKPIVKKDDKKGGKDAKGADKKGGKGGGAVEHTSIVAEVELHLESTEEYPDPNHGPTAALWSLLLDVPATDLHEKCQLASTLTSLVQGSSTELAILVINQGATVTFKDGSGHSALMYALVMNQQAVVDTLVAAKADVDCLDGSRNPVVLFATVTLHQEDIDLFLSRHQDQESIPPIALYGRPTLMRSLLPTAMDFNVCCPEGLSPILMAMGLGEVDITIGGYPLHLQNEAYNTSEYDRDEIRMHVEEVIRAGTSVNSCSHRGRVPLHVAAARGDCTLIQTLVDNGAIPTALDSAGFLPLHYLSCCAPDNTALEAFDLLYKYTCYRPVERMKFQDYRTGTPEAEKNALDVEKFIEKAFVEALSPLVIGQQRMYPFDALHRLTDDQMNVLQLCFVGPVLFKDDPRLKAFIINNKESRMELALHIINLAQGLEAKAATMLGHIDAKGLSVLHASSLLFQGMTPQIDLTDRQKKQKRVRLFVSKEAQILDAIYATMDDIRCAEIVNSLCYHELTDIPSLGSCWSLVHPATFWDNPELVSSLLEKGLSLEDKDVVHFLCERCPTASKVLVDVVIAAAASHPGHHRTLLNDKGAQQYGSSPSRPLHLAVRCGNTNAVRGLAECVKVDLNAVDEVSGKTALFEAVEAATSTSNTTKDSNNHALGVLKAFQPGSDRLDLFAGAESAAAAVALEAAGASVESMVSAENGGTTVEEDADASADADAGASADAGAGASEQQEVGWAIADVPAADPGISTIVSAATTTTVANQEEVPSPSLSKVSAEEKPVEASPSPPAGPQLLTPLNLALNTFNINVLTELISMRKNDVIQQLLQIVPASSLSSSSGAVAAAADENTSTAALASSTLLYRLEVENSALGAKAGLTIPPIAIEGTGATSAPAAAAAEEETADNAMSIASSAAAGEADGNAEADPVEATTTPAAAGEDAGRPHAMRVTFAADAAPSAAAAAVTNLPLPAVESTLATLDNSKSSLEDTNAAAAAGEEIGADAAAEARTTPGDVELEDLDVIEQSGIGGRALMDKKRGIDKFMASNAVLRIIIELVNGSGIVGEKDHYHSYYFAGDLLDK